MRVRIVEIGLLGPIEAHDGDGTRLVIPGGRPLTLLALLLTRRGMVVSPDFAAAALWPDRPPKDPDNALQLAVSRLRKAIGGADSRPAAPGHGVIASVPGGYVMRLPVGWTDADQFESLADAGRAQLSRGEADEAAGTLRRALGLWRGPWPTSARSRSPRPPSSAWTGCGSRLSATGSMPTWPSAATTR